MRLPVRLMAGVPLVLAGCLTSAPPTHPYRVAELGIEFRVPQQLGDLMYVLGDGGEGERGAFFSSRSLRAAGGPGCAAGARGGVSPYPLGLVVVSPEPPAKVRAEQRKNPEAGLGEFVNRVGDRYLYYRPAPQEPCAAGNRKAAALQRRQAESLRTALDTARPLR